MPGDHLSRRRPCGSQEVPATAAHTLPTCEYQTTYSMMPGISVGQLIHIQTCKVHRSVVRQSTFWPTCFPFNSRQCSLVCCAAARGWSRLMQ